MKNLCISSSIQTHKSSALNYSTAMICKVALIVAYVACVLSLVNALLRGGVVELESTSTVQGIITMTNSATGNALEVVTFQGSSAPFTTTIATYPTGGLGLGVEFNNQYGIVVDSHRVFAVNCGSNTISSFSEKNGVLTLKSVVSSGGVYPYSLDISSGSDNFLVSDILVVLNFGDATTNPSLQTYKVASDGTLTLIPSGNFLATVPYTVQPCQVSFSAGGQHIVVSTIISGFFVLSVSPAGVLTYSSYTNSTNGPFGFSVNQNNVVVASEVITGTVSSYTLSKGVLTLKSQSLPSGMFACWTAFSKDGETAYVVNFATNEITEYNVGVDGTLTYAGVVSTDQGPRDTTVSNNGRYLFVIHSTTETVNVYSIDSSGLLTQVQVMSGVTSGSNGLAYFHN